jgi:myo-inositol-1(or 4)-monophosphatase
MLKSTLIKAAQASGALIAEKINGKFSIEKKAGPNDLVTEVDKASEALIMDIIRQDFPDHFILSEEIGEVKMDSSYKWIIDPIDGTVNFANGIPLCCVSIGIEHEGEMIMGAVYNPMMNEFYFCEKGKGAFLNDNRLAVSQQDQVIYSCLVTGFPYTYLDMENGPLDPQGHSRASPRISRHRSLLGRCRKVRWFLRTQTQCLGQCRGVPNG